MPKDAARPYVGHVKALLGVFVTVGDCVYIGLAADATGRGSRKGHKILPLTQKLSCQDEQIVRVDRVAALLRDKPDCQVPSLWRRRKFPMKVGPENKMNQHVGNRTTLRRVY